MKYVIHYDDCSVLKSKVIEADSQDEAVDTFYKTTEPYPRPQIITINELGGK